MSEIFDSIKSCTCTYARASDINLMKHAKFETKLKITQPFQFNNEKLIPVLKPKAHPQTKQD